MAGNFHARVQWFARCIVALVVAGAVLCTVGYTLGAEHFWLLAQLQYLPYPVYLVTTLVAVAISFTLGCAWRVASMLGLALVAMTVMGFEFHTGDASTYRIRVMTYNNKGYLALDRRAGITLIAREMYNIARAAEAGHDGDPGHYRDFAVPPPGYRRSAAAPLAGGAA